MTDAIANVREERIRRIEGALDDMRDYLRRDGGGVELMGVDGRNVYIRMTGSCAGCSLAAVTVGGIQTRLIEKLGELVRVLPHTLMAAE